MSDTLRTDTLRLASSLPVGDPTRRKLLAAVQGKTAARLELGQVVMTNGVSHWARKDGSNTPFLRQILQRHQRGDWGETKGQDKRMNDKALKSGEDRIMSSYTAPDGKKLWIVTEWDRSVTTVLFPNEY